MELLELEHFSGNFYKEKQYGEQNGRQYGAIRKASFANASRRG
jgi:hypothetical protein